MAKRQHSAPGSTRPSLTGNEARAIILTSQGFGAVNLTHPIDILNRLGVLQLDSVNVLARPHELRCSAVCRRLRAVTVAVSC